MRVKVSHVTAPADINDCVRAAVDVCRMNDDAFRTRLDDRHYRAAFGRGQSFVPGAPTNIEMSATDSVKYAATGRRSYGRVALDWQPSRTEALLTICAPCHVRFRRAADPVFAHHAV